MATVREIFQSVCQADVEQTMSLLTEDPSLAQGTDLTGNTPLHVAALADWKPRPGHIEVAKRLLEYGAEVDALGYEENMEEATPLILAAFANHYEMVRLLLAHSADPNARGSNGQTPLSIAAAHDQNDIVEILLHYGARPDVHTAAKLGLTEEIRKLLVDFPHLLDEENPYDDLTPLESAAWHGQVETAEYLIGQGSNVTIFIAAGMGKIDWLENFLKAKSKLVATRPGTERFKKTGAPPLIWAARAGKTEAIQLLLEHGADVNAQDWWGMDALGHAVIRGVADSIDPLVRAGADVNRMTRGFTPIQRAFTGGHTEVVTALKAHGASVAT